jgi:hypothetical protein
MPNDDINAELWSFATAVRDAVYTAALAAYENARMDGLCHEGAQECALQAMRALDYQTLILRVTGDD